MMIAARASDTWEFPLNATAMMSCFIIRPHFEADYSIHVVACVSSVLIYWGGGG